MFLSTVNSYSLSLKVAFICILLSCDISYSQQLNFRQYSVDEGLPQAAVLAIYSDDLGMLHIGTQGGYSTFDGRTFTTINQKDGLNSNHVTVIYKPNKSETWLGHRYDAPTRIINDSVIAIQGGAADSINSSTSAIIATGNYVYFGTHENGLFGFRDDATVRIRLAKHGKEIKHISSFAAGADGTILVGTEQGLFYGKGTNFSAIQLPDSLSISSVNDIQLDKDGSFLVLTNDEIYRIYLLNGELIAINLAHKKIHPSTGAWESLLISGENDYWISSQNGAVHIQDGYEQLITAKNGLAQNHVSAIGKDREGTIWFGLFGHGLFQLLGEDFRLIDTSNGLMDNTVQAITSYKNEVWAGTEMGLTRFVFENEELLNISAIYNYGEKDGLVDDEVYGLVADPNGYIWISSYNGVSRFNYATGKFEQFKSGKKGLPYFLLSIEVDKAGNIWTCSLRDGCAKFSVKNGGIDEIALFNTSNGFFSDEIWRVFCDSKNNIWVGSNNNGLLKIAGSKMIHFEDKDGLTNARAGSITEDRYGNIWIGFIGGGIYRFDGNTFTNYTSADGITADNPYFVLADSVGHVWVGSNKGVDRFSIIEESISFFGKNEGFKGVETNQNACHIDKNGNLWFGTIKGLIHCLPQNIVASSIPPIVMIKGIRVFLKEKSLLDQVILNYDQNHLTFDFIGIHYTSPESVRYSFKLQGFDDEWSPVTSENAATYSNLPPGDYTFQVKAMNKGGVWSEPATFTVHITPPFWLTWWFIALATIIMLSIIYFVFQLRTMRLRKQSQLLKHKVAERTKELLLEKLKVDEFNEKLSEQNDLLAIKNKDITDSIRYAERIQRGMLPGKSEIEAIIPKSFILFKPRDIVSGDFYWTSDNNGKTYFSAIDCTGHGVPGAFMSLIGHDLLNQSIAEGNPQTTGELLTDMHNKLKNYFLKGGTKGINDGMDVAMCAILDHKTLEFSGAKRPLFHIRNKHLTTYKGDRYSIGEAENNVAFSTATIATEPGDMIYLFSDGYQDQFGGEHISNKKPGGKKFMLKRFKNLLIEISDKPVEEQHRILESTFEDWRGELEQVDDVCVIGVRL
jgi:ligand-binding sensor domain-containing protein/serine phosphatase RsbU (regulator of sigma subunit)